MYATAWIPSLIHYLYANQLFRSYILFSAIFGFLVYNFWQILKFHCFLFSLRFAYIKNQCLIPKISILLSDFDHHRSDTFFGKWQFWSILVSFLFKFFIFSSLLSNAFVQYQLGCGFYFILESKSVKHNRYFFEFFVRIRGQEGVFFSWLRSLQ